MTFLHSNNANITAIQETKQTDKTKSPKTPGWAAVQLDHHKNKGGGLPIPIKDIILEQQGILITMPNRQQLHIHSIYILPCSGCSAGHNASIVHLLGNNEMSLIVGDINAHHSIWDTNTNENGAQLADEIDAATTPFLTRMNLRGNRQMAGQFRPTSVWPPMTLHCYQTGQSLPHWPAIICQSSSPSTLNCPRLMGLYEPTSTSRKRTGHVMLKPATNTWLNLAKQEPSNKTRRPSGKQ